MKNIIRISFVLIPLTLYGCAFLTPEEKETMKSDIEGLTKSSSAITTDLDSIKMEITSLKEEINKVKDELGKLRANLSADISIIRDDSLKTSGGLEEARFELKRSKENEQLLAGAVESLEQRVKDVESLVIKVTTLEKEQEGEKEEKKKSMNTLSAVNTAVEELRKSAVALNERVKKLEEKKEGDKPNPQALYEEGLDLIREKKDYAKGLESLQRFLTLYPEHELADNSQYWIGESYYAQGDWERAIVEFNKVIKQYPAGDKVPASLLKQGYSFEKLGSVKEAEVIFERLMEKYPKTEEAEGAKARLKEIKK